MVPDWKAVLKTERSEEVISSGGDSNGKVNFELYWWSPLRMEGPLTVRAEPTKDGELLLEVWHPNKGVILRDFIRR